MSRWQAFKIKVWNFFKNSGTIVWARLQYVIGILAAGLIATFSTYDWSQLASMDAATMFKMLAFAPVSGVLTEILRRKGTATVTSTVANAETNFEPVQVERLERVEPIPPMQG
jgi:hypothetical protein